MKHLTLLFTILLFSLTVSADNTTAPDPNLPGGTIIELDKVNKSEQPTDQVPETKDITEQPQVENVEQPSEVTPEPTQSRAPQLKNQPAAAKKVESPNAIYTVQLGAFKARERAFALYWQMSKKVSPLQVTAPLPNDKLYRVRYGSYPNKEEAQAAAKKLREKGIECFVTTLKTSEIIPLKQGEQK